MQTPLQSAFLQFVDGANACTRLLVLVLPQVAVAQTGFHQQVLQVSAETRLDWVYPILGQTPREPPQHLLEGYPRQGPKYDFFGPELGVDNGPLPLVIFVSPWDRRGGWSLLWESTCRKNSVLYAGVKGMGNGHPIAHRIRAVLDVLDDVRSRYSIDPDRTYLTGYSGGAYVAARTAFALPEYFGGVLCIGDAPEPPLQAYQLARVRSRLSVAILCGEKELLTPRMEDLNLPWWEAAGVRVEAVFLRNAGHELPDSEWADRAYTWLEEGLHERITAYSTQPALRIGDAPSRAEWADRQFRDAKQMLAAGNDSDISAGLIQLEGLAERWPDTLAAQRARPLISEYSQRQPRPWEILRDTEDLKLLRIQAEGYERLARDPRKVARQRQGSTANYATYLWEEVQRRSHDPSLHKLAESRIKELTEIAVEAPEESNHFPLTKLRFGMEGDLTLQEAIGHMQRTLASIGYELKFDHAELEAAGIDFEQKCHPRIKAGTFAEIDRRFFHRVGLKMQQEGNSVTLSPLGK